LLAALAWGNDLAGRNGFTVIDVAAVSSPWPVLIHAEPPEYTEAAAAAQIEGVVRLQAIVDVDGLAKDIRIVRSLDPGLDQNAIQTVRKWRFRPARDVEDGHAFAAKITLDVRFNLSRKQ
jgi:TonB family protein